MPAYAFTTPGRSAASRVETTMSASAALVAWPVTAARKSSRPSVKRLESVTARTLAVRGTSRMSAISPKTSPGPRSTPGRPSTSTASSPDATM